MILMRSGLRSQEMCDLKIADVRVGRDRNQIRVASGKGGKERVVGVDCVLNDALVDYLGRDFMDGRTYVFETSAGKKWQTSHVRRLLASMGKSLGLPGRLHPHGLRATMATDMLREGLPLDTVSAQLGHAHVSTTDIYIKRTANAHVGAVAQRGMQ